MFSNCRPAPPHPCAISSRAASRGTRPRRSFPPLKRAETAVLPQALKALITAQDLSSSTEPLLIFSLPPPADAGMAGRCCALCPRPVTNSTCASAREDTNGGPRMRPGAGGGAPSLPPGFRINKKELTWENLLFDLCPHVSGSGFAPG